MRKICTLLFSLAMVTAVGGANLYSRQHGVHCHRRGGQNSGVDQRQV